MINILHSHNKRSNILVNKSVKVELRMNGDVIFYMESIPYDGVPNQTPTPILVNAPNLEHERGESQPERILPSFLA